MRILLLSLVVLSITACKLNSNYVAPTQKYQNEGEGNVDANQQKELAAALLNDFPDIPVPVGYRVDLKQSTSFYSPNYSAGKIVLIGSSQSGLLFKFFADEMVANGWTLVNKMQSEVSVLNFAKPGKLVSVNIFLDGKITILIAPQ